MTTKERLLASINKVQPLNDYDREDCIFSIKYRISPTDMTYVLLDLSRAFNFTINDDFVDALEMCTFARLEQLLEQNEGTTS